MPPSLIRISDLRKEEGDKTVNDLAEFLEKKLDTKVEITSSEINLSYEDEEDMLSRSYLRVLLRKFLHKAGLREWFRVISGGEDTFIIKIRRE